MDVTVIIPGYKPDKKILKKVFDALKNQDYKGKVPEGIVVRVGRPGSVEEDIGASRDAAAFFRVGPVGIAGRRGVALHRRRGAYLVATGRRATVPVGDALLGRVLDAIGEPLDSGGPLPHAIRRTGSFLRATRRRRFARDPFRGGVCGAGGGVG